MVSYLLNKASGVLHKLPASESCNTDQIHQKLRFEIHASETVLDILQKHPVRFCLRCFHDPD